MFFYMGIMKLRPAVRAYRVPYGSKCNVALTIKKRGLKAEFAHMQATNQGIMLDNGVLRFTDHPHAYTVLVARIAPLALARCAAMAAGEADIVRVLRKYVAATIDVSTAPPDSAIRPGLSSNATASVVARALPAAVSLNRYAAFQQGAVWRDYEIDTWAGLADLVVYELKSEINYLTEIELAEMVTQSARVASSVQTAIDKLSQCLASVFILKLDENDKPGRDADARAALKGSFVSDAFRSVNKHYRSFEQVTAQSSLAELSSADPAENNLEQKISLLHDLFQTANDFFALDAHHIRWARIRSGQLRHFSDIAPGLYCYE